MEPRWPRSRGPARQEVAMRVASAIAMSVTLLLTFVPPAFSQQPEAAASGAASSGRGDELHFVTTLNLTGEVLSVNPEKRLITLRSADGVTGSLETRNAEMLKSVKARDRVSVRYFVTGKVSGAQTEPPLVELTQGLFAKQSRMFL